MEEKKTSTFEKIAYAMGDSGSGSFVWLFTSSFLMLYYTDGVLAAAGTIGTMMLIMRVFDGFSDILFGVLLENTSTRIGKARPWFGASSIPLVISFILMFHVPSNIGKTAYYKRKKNTAGRSAGFLHTSVPVLLGRSFLIQFPHLHNLTRHTPSTERSTLCFGTHICTPLFLQTVRPHRNP